MERIISTHGSPAEILDFEYDPEEDVIVLHKLKFNGNIMRPSTYAQLVLRELESQNVSYGPIYIGMKLTEESGFRLHSFGRGTYNATCITHLYTTRKWLKLSHTNSRTLSQRIVST